MSMFPAGSAEPAGEGMTQSVPRRRGASLGELRVRVNDGAGSGADSFGRYWRAQAVSGAGTYVTLFALQVMVVQTLDRGAVEVGWLNAARWAPYLVLGLIVEHWWTVGESCR